MKERPVRFFADLDPARRIAAAFEELEAAWRDAPAPTREPLQRLFWLRPDGEVVVYRSSFDEPDTEG